jgi:UDP-N-acetylglucosamine 1-carboxyvinyltransferase
MATRLLIDGGRPLGGEVQVSAAKNAALPALCAALLTSETVVLENVPALADVVTTRSLLERLGAEISTGPAGATTVRVGALASHEAPYELVSTMRASVLVLGPLLARAGVARVALPGGCAIGLRPIDQHLKGFQKLGADIVIRSGYVEARASRLKGARITTDLVTVTGTENLMMAATLAEGTTVLENAAREPEVADLARLLVAMGARIDGAGTERIEIEGVPEISGARHRIIPDRIEAGTLLVAGAITGGDVTVTGAAPRHLTATLAKLEECGAMISVDGDRVRCRARERPQAADVITSPFPRRGGRPLEDHRDHLREPLHACRRALPDGRADRDRGVDGRRAWRHRVSGCSGDGDGPPGLGFARPGRTRRARDHGGVPRLSPGPWLRAARSQAPVPRRRDPASGMR